jgi:hypothetical protein
VRRGELSRNDREDSQEASPVTALRALLAGIVDYSGLFPPAGLDLPAAAGNYAVYRASDDAWMLGRFVVPVARLDELAVLLRARGQAGSPPWRLAALAGSDVSGDLTRVREFNGSNGSIAIVDCVEAKLADRDAIERAANASEDLELFVELPAGVNPEPLVEVLSRRGLHAKLRTGGVTGEAFPSTAEALRFMRICIDAGVAFKATAGLHHPITATYPLTYQPASPVHRMFGFVNLFLTAAALAHGIADEDAAALLDESESAAISVADDAVRWRDCELTASALERARERTVRSFGSCSFREPVDGVTEVWGAA